MATERCLMLGVKAGGDRQALHEVHPAAQPRGRARGRGDGRAQRPAATGSPPTRLSGASRWPKWRAGSTRREFVGRSPEQVDEYLREVVDPLLADLPEAPPTEVHV